MRLHGRSNNKRHNRPSKSHADDGNAIPEDRSWGSHQDYRQHRSSYDMNREPSSRYDADWRSDNAHDGYDRSEYRRTSTDVDFRPSENWARNTETHRFQSREEWPQRYDPPYPSSYTDSSSWSKHPYDDRSTYWSDSRSHLDERSHDDRHSNRDQWRSERHDRVEQRWQTDPSWDSRRPDDAHSWEEPKRPDPVETRSWEPAASWKASNRSESHTQRSHNMQSISSSKSSKTSKKAQRENKQHRDWKEDDSDLNNWQRRDSRPHEKSHSRKPRSYSRSRSPAESQHTRLSSRGRSKSRSASPAHKRRKRDRSPAVYPAPSPDRGRSRRQTDHQYPASPSSNHHHHTRDHRRQRSVSSGSTHSSDTTPRAVHRLPPAPSDNSTNITDPPSRNTNHSSRNGKNNQSNGKNKRSHTSKRSSNMPPPASAPLALPSFLPAKPMFATVEPESPESLPPIHLFPPERSEEPARQVKVGGFKPIGQVHPTLKKFFPGDDDEIDHGSLPPSAAISSTSQNERKLPGPPRSSINNVAPPPPLIPRSPTPRVEADPEQELEEQNGVQSRMPSTPIDKPVESEDISAETPSQSAESQSELYTIVSQVGEGTFGRVYKAKNTVTNTYVALKRIRMEAEKDGFPVTAMREIKLLQSLRHDNVVRLYEMMVSRGTAYMVFEYMDHDLTGVLSQSQFTFTPAHLKSLCHQMLAGLAYLHHKGVIHRDIKGPNILINNHGELKLADFGLARFYQKRRRTDYTNRVITLWYRAPELLFGATEYGPEVDMWSAGCIMLELFTKKPVFQGNDEIHQLEVIYKVIGSPTQERWPGIVNLPWFELVKPKDVVPNHFRTLFQKWMTPAALDLAEHLLSYDPEVRFTAAQAMNTPYFLTEEPAQVKPDGLADVDGEWHELETKRERAKKRKKE